MSLIKKLAGETLYYGVGSILPKVLNFVILARYLTSVFSDDQGKFGIHGIMYAFAALLMVLATYRMETAFFRFGSKEGDMEKTFSTASISLIFTTFFAFLLVFFFAQPIAGILTESSDAIYVQLFAGIMALDVLSAIPYARLRLENKPKRFAFIRIINVVVTILVLFFFLEFLPYLIEKGNSWASEFYQKESKLSYVFLSNLIASAVVLALLSPAYRKLKWDFDWVLFKKMLWYSAPLIIVGIAGVINNYLDRYLIQKLSVGDLDANQIQSGIYNACIKIAVLMQLFITAFNYAAEPFFFKQSRQSDDRLIYAQVGQIFTIVASLAFLGVMLYLDLAKFIIDSSYHAGLKVVPVMLLAYLFQGLFYNFSIWYKITDKTHIGAIIAIGGSIITILINVILIPQIGIMASAWAALTCFGFMAITGYLTGRHYHPIPYPIFRIFGYILLSVIFYFLSEWIRPYLNENLISILFVNTLIIIGYIGVIFGWERKLIMGILRG